VQASAQCVQDATLVAECQQRHRGAVVAVADSSQVRHSRIDGAMVPVVLSRSVER